MLLIPSIFVLSLPTLSVFFEHIKNKLYILNFPFIDILPKSLVYVINRCFHKDVFSTFF
jgi:hypothetical protein